MKRLVPLLLVALFFISSCELSTPPTQGELYTMQVALDYYTLLARTGAKYPDEPLDGTISDAKALHHAWEGVADELKLTHIGYQFLQEGSAAPEPFSHKIGEKIIEAYPTKDAIETAIEALKAVTKKEDLIIFSYSGHAAQGRITLLSEDKSRPELYDVATLLAKFSTVPGRKLILLDACETGLAITPSPNSSSTLLGSSINTWYQQYFTKSDTPPLNLMVISSSADTDSYERTVNGVSYGVFTRALLIGLGWNPDTGTMGDTLGPAFKDTFLSVDSLYTYIKKNQSFPLKRSLFNPLGKYQHPMTSGGAVDMILFDN